VEWRLIKSPIVASRPHVGLVPDKPRTFQPVLSRANRSTNCLDGCDAMRVEQRSVKPEIVGSRRHVGPGPDKCALFIPSFNASTNQRL
jgi:hypothetical protein